MGDGHYIFRAISKAITGTQSYHTDFRKDVVEWMPCEDHPQNLAQYIAPFDSVSDCQSAIQKYIDDRRMSPDGWGGDKEICPFATMFKIVICVSTSPLVGIIITHQFFQMKKLKQITICTCITQTVSHIMTLLFSQKQKKTFCLWKGNH